jgi:hypothetical protein
MKPSSAKAEPTGAAPETGASVTDELRAIDTSVLDQLLEMRQEEVRIEEYRQRADKMKEAVDPLVWQRVVTDYKARLAALEARAKPLKAQARKEYAKLRVLLDRITAEQKAAQVSKAELDFRHAVGELDDAELAERLQGPVGIIARCDDELTSVGALKTRFVEAFGAEIELEAPEPAPPATPAPPVSPDVTPAPMEASDATAFVMVEELHAEATIVGVGVNVTQPLPSSAGTTAPDPAATVLHTPAAAATADAADEHTFLLAPAALIIGPDEPSPQEYRLAAVNYLGRSDDSHLQIARPGVSRRHAVIMAAGGAFVIQDLGSQNGVFVDGERISEHTLKDGEQIVIGDRTMLYRTPWPQQGRSRTRATKA